MGRALKIVHDHCRGCRHLCARSPRRTTRCRAPGHAAWLGWLVHLAWPWSAVVGRYSAVSPLHAQRLDAAVAAVTSRLFAASAAAHKGSRCPAATAAAVPPLLLLLLHALVLPSLAATPPCARGVLLAARGQRARHIRVLLGCAAGWSAGRSRHATRSLRAHVVVWPQRASRSYRADHS